MFISTPTTPSSRRQQVDGFGFYNFNFMMKFKVSNAFVFIEQKFRISLVTFRRNAVVH